MVRNYVYIMIIYKYITILTFYYHLIKIYHNLVCMYNVYFILYGKSAIHKSVYLQPKFFLFIRLKLGF